MTRPMDTFLLLDCWPAEFHPGPTQACDGPFEGGFNRYLPAVEWRGTEPGRIEKRCVGAATRWTSLEFVGPIVLPNVPFAWGKYGPEAGVLRTALTLLGDVLPKHREFAIRLHHKFAHSVVFGFAPRWRISACVVHRWVLKIALDLLGSAEAGFRGDHYLAIDETDEDKRRTRLN